MADSKPTKHIYRISKPFPGGKIGHKRIREITESLGHAFQDRDDEIRVSSYYGPVGTGTKRADITINRSSRDDPNLVNAARDFIVDLGYRVKGERDE